MSKQKNEMVLIHFVDAQLLDTGLVFPDELEYEPAIASLIGFLVKETKEVYFIAKEVWETGQCKYIHIIPKEYVKEIYPLEVAAAKKQSTVGKKKEMGK